MLKSLLDDFSGHNIEAACALVETAGRFLIRLPETKSRCAESEFLFFTLMHAAVQMPTCKLHRRTCMQALACEQGQRLFQGSASDRCSESCQLPALSKPPPHTRSMEAMSESMVKLKNAKHLDARQAAAVDGAYAACRPPEGGARRRKARPPAHEYVRYLVFDCLGENSVAGVMKQLLRLPWAQHERYVLKCLLKARAADCFGGCNIMAKCEALKCLRDGCGIMVGAAWAQCAHFHAQGAVLRLVRTSMHVR